MPAIIVELELVAYGGVYVRIPSPRARVRASRGPYGEDTPVTADVSAYVQSDDALREAIGDAVADRAIERARRYGRACVPLPVDTASALWRWHLEESTHDHR